MPELAKLNNKAPVFTPGDGSIVAYFQETEKGLLQLLARKPDGSTQVVLTSVKQEDEPDVPAYSRKVTISEKNFSVSYYVKSYITGAYGEIDELDLRPYVSCGSATGLTDNRFRYDYYFHQNGVIVSGAGVFKDKDGILGPGSMRYGTGQIKVIVSFPDADPGEIFITLIRDYSDYRREEAE